MKAFLDRQQCIRQLLLALLALLTLRVEAASAISEGEFTQIARQWSRTRSLQQLYAISNEILGTLEQYEQFITLDGLPGVYRVDIPSSESKSNDTESVIVSIQKIVTGGTLESAIEFTIPLLNPRPFLKGSAPIEITIRPHQFEELDGVR